jgi:hypothetical protein
MTCFSVYSDLDMDCLRPIDELIYDYNVTSVPHQTLVEDGKTPLPSGKGEDEMNVLKGFVGRMVRDESHDNSIPNAWMASTPGHPFFMHMLVAASQNIVHGSTSASPEVQTGPVALFNGIKQYNSLLKSHPGDVEEPIHMFEAFGDEDNKPLRPFHGNQWKTEVVILPAHAIYPYSWMIDGAAFKEVCSAESSGFDSETCKSRIQVDRWPSYAITYWSHTWTSDGHQTENLQKVSR